MASTWPAAKQAILDLLTPIPDLNAVQITWGEPTEVEDLQDEMIFFRGPVPRSAPWGPLGARQRDEIYNLTLVIKNRVVGDDEYAAETRAAELLDLVESALVGERLGVLLKPVDFDDEHSYESVPVSDGWFGEIELVLTCTARI